MNENSFLYTFSTIIQVMATIASILVAVAVIRIGNRTSEIRKRAGLLYKWARNSVMDDGDIINEWEKGNFLKVATLFEEQLNGPDRASIQDESGYIKPRQQRLKTFKMDSLSAELHIEAIKSDAELVNKLVDDITQSCRFFGLIIGMSLLSLPFSCWMSMHLAWGGTILLLLVTASLVCIGWSLYLIYREVTPEF